jgi:hypothetical protein
MTRNRHIIGTVVALLAAACLYAPTWASAGTLLSGYGGPGVGNQAILGSALLGGPSGGGPSGGAGSGTASSEATSLPAQSSSQSGASPRTSTRAPSHHRSATARTGHRTLAVGDAAEASGSTGRTYYVRARDVSQPPLGFSGTRLGLLILGIVVLVLTGAVMRRLLAVGPTKARAAQGVPDITRLTPE